MRVKHLWLHCDVPAKASLVWSRITFSSLTTAYFVVAVLHCIIQVIIQAMAFSSNAKAADHLWSLVQSQNQTVEGSGFAVLGDDLRICYTLPSTINPDSCQVIWKPDGHSDLSPGVAAEAASMTSSTPDSTSTAVYVSFSTAVPAINGSSPSAIQPSDDTLPPVASVSNDPSVALASLTAIATTVPTSAVSVFASPTSQALAATGTLGLSSSSPVSSSTPSILKVGVIPSSLNPFKGKNLGGGGQGVGDASVNNLGNGEGDNLTFDHRGLSPRSAADSNVPLTLTCVKTLIWPVQTLENTKREDITLIGFQIWVLGMSIVALLNESIPHIYVALLMHLLVTVWTIFQVFQTDRFRRQFAKIITNGACRPTNLLGPYWQARQSAEITSAVLNCAALFVTAFLTYRLMKIYGWQTFKRVGASLTINRVYRLVLSLSIAIQICLFFITSAAALWLDQLYNGPIGHFASLRTLYKGGVIVMFCLLVPWLSLGWFSVRREARRLALAFLVLNLLFIGLWAAMFDATSFRWTFMLWPFFAFVAVAAGALMMLTLLLGFACRLNFGKGLPRYLNTVEPLDGDDFIPVFSEKGLDDDPEKVEFPSSTGRPIPTFSATFGKGSEVPRLTHMPFGYLRGDPMTRSVSSSSGRGDRQLARNDSNGSQMSHNSSNSTSSQRSDVGKRWVIE